jgi:predicted MFS family arabinose efflux permease
MASDGISSPALLRAHVHHLAAALQGADTNLKMLSLQSQLPGAAVGAWVMQRLGYAGLLMVDAAVCLLGAALSRVHTSRG